jgi:hypothetical protein
MGMARHDATKHLTRLAESGQPKPSFPSDADFAQETIGISGGNARPRAASFGYAKPQFHCGERISGSANRKEDLWILASQRRIASLFKLAPALCPGLFFCGLCLRGQLGASVGATDKCCGATTAPV